MLYGRDAERAQLKRLLDEVASGPVGCMMKHITALPVITKGTLGKNRFALTVRRSSSDKPTILVVGSGGPSFTGCPAAGP